MPKTTEKDLKKAIIKHRGILSSVAKSCGTSRTTVHKRINNNQRLKDALNEARESFIDDGESALVLAIKNQESWAVSLLLKTLGANRGYIEKKHLDVSTPPDSKIQIEFVKSENSDTR